MGDKEKEVSEPQDSAPAETAAALAKKRWWTKKIVVVTGPVIAFSLLSYGPAVKSAINKYGRTSDFAESLYTPADWLAQHFGLYHDYRLFWAKQSRNYPWWMQHAGQDTNNPLLPQLSRNPGSTFQPPPEAE